MTVNGASKMRVCQVVAHVDEEASGPSYSVPRLSQSLALSGQDVVLATLRSRGRSSSFDGIRHVEFENTGWPKRLGVSWPMQQWFAANATGFDIIHGHGLWMMPNIYPAQAAGANNVVYIVSPRGTLSEAAMRYSSRIKAVFWALAQKSALARATAFHATSDEEYADIRRTGFSQPVAIIPNAVDVAQRPAVKATQGRRTLLYLGRIHPKKGLDIALPAWRRLQDAFPEWDFRVVGRGDAAYIESLCALVRQIGAERISFEAPVYGDDKLNVMRSADLLVLPTRNENFGMVVAEALAQETPAITTKGAPWEGLIANKCGWWTEIAVEPIAAALEEAFNLAPEALRDMGMRGRDWVLRDFSWDAVGTDMTSFYNWVRRGDNPPKFVRLN